MSRESKIPFLLLLLAGEIMASASVIFIRRSAMAPVMLSSFRMLFSVLLLLPFYLKELKQNPAQPKPFNLKDMKQALIPGLLLGLHFISWIMGARMIPAANASLIVNLTPVVTPLFLFLLLRERVSKGEILGSLIALGGCLYLAWGDLNLDRQYFMGDLITLGSMGAFALYQIMAKTRMKGVWSYLVPLYFIGGIFCLIVGLTQMPLGSQGWIPWSRNDWIAVLGLALISTIGGHSIINYSMKHLRGQLVSVFHTSQFLYAGLMAYFFLNEIPGRRFLEASPFILGGVIFTILAGHRQSSKVEPAV